MVNFEASAREKRYYELDKLSNKLDIPIIFTAHHLDDQIETLYMKMLDKSDWISMIGIRNSMGKVKRPLLNLQKEVIDKFEDNLYKKIRQYHEKNKIQSQEETRKQFEEIKKDIEE